MKQDHNLGEGIPSEKEPGKTPSFARVFRGYDPAEVDAFFEQLQVRTNQLASGRPYDSRADEIANLVDSMVGDITEVLKTAVYSADEMRKRAEGKMNSFLTQAEQQAEHYKTKSQDDAYQVRQSAWEMAAVAIDSMEEMIIEMEAEADRRALQIISESERTAHRNLAEARRDSSRIIQEANTQAEQILAQARQKREGIVKDWERRVESLKKQVEIETVRRDRLSDEVKELASELDGPEDIPEIPTVQLVSSGQENGRNGAGGPEKQSHQNQEENAPLVDGQDIAEEISRLRKFGVASGPEKVSLANGPSEKAAEKAEVDNPTDSNSPVDARPNRSVGPAASDQQLAKMWSTGKTLSTVVSQESVPSTLGSLFEDLRRMQDIPPEDEAQTPPVPVSTKPRAKPETMSVRQSARHRTAPAPRSMEVERYQKTLLPIANRTLRNIKRQLIDIHNAQLDELNHDPENWQPIRSSLDKRLVHDLDIMHSEAFIAGFTVATEMLKRNLAVPRSEIPAGTPDSFISALFDELVLTVQAGRETGQGTRALGSAMSAVYRVWRTDEAERRVLFLAGRSYHQGFLLGMQMSGGKQYRLIGEGCRTCQPLEGPGLISDARPVPSDYQCRCTIAPA